MRDNAQQPEQAVPVAPFNPDRCEQGVFDNGLSVGLFDIPKPTANALCQALTQATGRAHDWHYIAGRVHLKVAHPPAQAQDVVRDAERYRWLAGCCRSTSEHWGGRWSIIINGPAPKTHDSEDDLDEAIDAAMLAAK